MTTHLFTQDATHHRARLARGGEPVPRPSPLLVSMATRYFTGYLRKHFHAVRMLTPPPPLEGRPAIVFLNHASWWDPLTCMVLARHFFPGRRHHAPIDAIALEKYRFLLKLGMFPLDRHSRAGVAAFLRTAASLLADDATMLWITPEGQFTDSRTRPTVLRPGVGHLARLAPAARIVPLAIEYTFWNERHPELLLNFSAPVSLKPRGTAAEATLALARTLQEAQDALAEAAQTRDPRRFATLLAGAGGVHPVYDQFRRVASFLRGRPFTPNHEDAAP
jgi:1-acyl-sn-glycerol-3-phosphate acyltransferase